MSNANNAAIISLIRRSNTSESSCSSSSDEEWGTISRGRGKRSLRPRNMNYMEVTTKYSDSEFKSHFRISRDTFNYLQELIREDLNRKVPGCPSICSRKQLMVALWKMATVDSYRTICDRFNIGRATAVRAVRRVTNALFTRAPIFIQWPSGEQAISVMRGFETAGRFPKVIGAIDGTHIKIIAPKENAVDYINRKGFHSIQLQLVCDHKCSITHRYVGHPGSVHDQRVFRLSEVHGYLNDVEKFPDNSHILGDAAYEIHEHLLTPFRDNGHLTERQKIFNHAHSITRVTVERCIGLLKGRMRSLLHCLPMTRVDLMSEYIVAFCVIHNICMLRGDEFAIINIVGVNPETIDIRQRIQQNAGTQKRNAIMNML